MRLIFIFPKMTPSSGYSLFTGINVYGIEGVVGLTVGVFGFGIAVEYFNHE